jgi:4-amino-4-deoxy-L-arabinose transferase-like glycosyltransferase
LLAALFSTPPIAARGEAREGLVVRELVASGDWVLPRRLGVIASKPPLYHWLATGAVRLFGWSDTAVRLPSTLAAWAVVLETFAFGMLIEGPTTAWLAVGILFTTWGFWRSATEARVDMLFAACIAGSVTIGLAIRASAQALPDGPDRALVERKCGSCHDTEMVAINGRSRENWNGTIDEMIGYGMQVSPTERTQILDYLATYVAPK